MTPESMGRVIRADCETVNVPLPLQAQTHGANETDDLTTFRPVP